jgi:hypothetical protein
MTTSGDVGIEIVPEVADDPHLAARLDDLCTAFAAWCEP